MTTPESNDESEDTQADVDPFEELGVEQHLPGDHSGDGLDAFMDDEDEEDQIETTRPESAITEEEDEDDDDLFATLGVAGPAVSLASAGQDDLLSAFMDEDEEVVEVEEPATTTETKPSAPDAKDAYKMVLETVWVDGILDPGEVNLLARRREELNLSFEEHLELVRQMLGD
tara:strand:+ start:737 stop:1252 length:516 start_codon:yes stop_codon:yes gene_type:complete